MVRGWRLNSAALCLMFAAKIPRLTLTFCVATPFLAVANSACYLLWKSDGMQQNTVNHAIWDWITYSSIYTIAKCWGLALSDKLLLCFLSSISLITGGGMDQDLLFNIPRESTNTLQCNCRHWKAAKLILIQWIFLKDYIELKVVQYWVEKRSLTQNNNGSRKMNHGQRIMWSDLSARLFLLFLWIYLIS